MAAAYAFHIAKNHPFVDGNKRTALGTALVFLDINGITIKDPKRKLHHAMLQLSQDHLNKEAFTEILRKLFKDS
jgi:death-on-curing protein